MPVPSFSTSVYLVRNATLAGISDSKKLMFSCWFNTGDTAGGERYFLIGTNSAGTEKLLIGIDADGKLHVKLRASAADTVIYEALSPTAYDDSDWHHVVIAVDLSATTVNVYVDRTAVTMTVSTAAANSTIGLEPIVAWAIGNNRLGSGSNYTGSFYDFLFKAGVYVDITDTDEIEKFVSSDGRTASGDLSWQNVGPNAGVKPVGYGNQGAISLGGVPADIYFSGNFQNNLGTGGAFAINNLPFSDGGDGPDVYRHAAHYDNKERWYDSELTGFSYTKSRTFIETREGHPKRGLRMGIDERDEKFRQEYPSQTFNQLMFNDKEDDSEERDR